MEGGQIVQQHSSGSEISNCTIFPEKKSCSLLAVSLFLAQKMSLGKELYVHVCL